jgi:hypothetical protein
MNSPLPLKLSIVTPSYNQGRFLEDALRSVLDQGYPALEYVVMDGASSDGSADIIRRYAPRLTHWQSEPDGGQYEAIQAGFAHTTGSVMAWLNSDDKYTPWAFAVVAEIFQQLPQVEWLTTLLPLLWDSRGVAVHCWPSVGHSRESFYRGENLPGGQWFARGWIQQETTFWRRSLWERAGGYLDTSLRYAADFELWARFYQHAELYAVNTPLGGFRRHGDQKTVLRSSEYLAEAKQAIARYAPSTARGQTLRRLDSELRGRARERLPQRWLRWSKQLGLAHPRKVCMFSESRGAWDVVCR